MKTAKEFLGIQGSDDELELNVYASKVIKWMEDYNQYIMEQQQQYILAKASEKLSQKYIDFNLSAALKTGWLIEIKSTES